MEPKNGGLEDDFPFQLGDVWVPCQFSGGYTSNCETKYRPRKQIKICASSLSMEVSWRTGKV